MKTDFRFNPAATEKPTSTRVLWMVVDDNEGILDFLASMLETLGIADVQRFSSSAEALRAFTAAPERFQFVITDLEMPGMNGIELCRRLHEVAPQLKILLATGSGITNETGARQCGFCGLLTKPFPPAELLRTVRAAGVLDRSNSRSNN